MKNGKDGRLLFAISKAVYVARARCGLTQEQLAKKVGTKQSGIARLENSYSFPSFRLIKKVADALDQNVIFKFEPKVSNDPRFIEWKENLKVQHSLKGASRLNTFFVNGIASIETYTPYRLSSPATSNQEKMFTKSHE